MKVLSKEKFKVLAEANGWSHDHARGYVDGEAHPIHRSVRPVDLAEHIDAIAADLRCIVVHVGPVPVVVHLHVHILDGMNANVLDIASGSSCRL